MPEIVPAPGVLLVAPPVLDDPNFLRSVVYLCQVDEDGAFGLVLTHPLDLALSALVEGFDRATPLPLRQGGPVQPETLHVLHRVPERVPGGQALPGGVAWGGDFDALAEAFASDDVSGDDVAFFLGYAGWAPGQLDDELARHDWLLTPAHADDLFAASPDEVWARVLRRMGPPHSYLVNFPADPRLN